MGGIFSDLMQVIDGLRSPGVALDTEIEFAGQPRALVHRNDHRVSVIESPLVARKHEILDLGTLAAWLHRHAKAAVTEIGVGRHSVRVIRVGDECRDMVQARLYVTAVVADLGGATGDQRDERAGLVVAAADRPVTALSQASFHRFLREHIGVIEQGPELLAAIAKIEIAEGQKFKLQLEPSGLQSYVGGSRELEVTGTIPASFVVSTPFYEEVDAADASQITVLITVATGSGGVPLFTLECPGLEAARREARGRIRDRLDALLNADSAEAWQVGIGTYDAVRRASILSAVDAPTVK